MKILVFTTVFYPAIGGIENHTLLLANSFVENGHEVKVITYQRQKGPLPNIEVFYRPSIFKSIQLFFWCTTYYMPNISLKGVWLLIFNPKKTWVISHNDFSSCNQTGVISVLKNTANRFATKNIAVSKSIARYVKNGTIIQNCYDQNVFRRYEPENRDIDFVFVGRLVSQKGCELLLKACSTITKDFKLYCIGNGPEKERLEQLTLDLNLGNHVVFTGFLTGNNLAQILNRSRVLIVPSIDNEGFGMVVLEGLACGCKVIAANAAGLTEAVSDYGTLFNMGNEKELAILLQNELIDKEIASVDDIYLKSYLKKHSSAVVAKNYLHFFS